MNERIKKLIKEAGFSDDFIDDCELGYTQQKFAELIVKECLNIVGHYADVDEGIAVAKKNFGVE
jgi:hypothetical protein